VAEYPLSEAFSYTYVTLVNFMKRCLNCKATSVRMMGIH